MVNDVNHADDTWTQQETGINWLRDLIVWKAPESIGEYLPIDTVPMWCSKASDAGVEEQANNMLVFLSSKRTVRSLPSRTDKSWL